MKAKHEQIVTANGIELCVETFGDSSDPAIMLIHGAGNSLLSWADELCDRLAVRRPLRQPRRRKIDDVRSWRAAV